MKNGALGLIVSAAMLAGTPAFAGGEPGFYVGAGVGSFGADIGGFSGSDVSFKALAGYDFGKYFAAEVEYIDGGSPDDRGLSVDISGTNVAALGTWPVSDRFELFAKLGMIFWSADVHGFGGDNGEDLSYGVGAAYDFTGHFGVRGEYQRFEIADTDSVDNLAVSILWRF
jgi:hypothetical protein